MYIKDSSNLIHSSMKVHPSLFKNEKYRELMTSNLNPKMPENTRDSEDRPVSFMQE